MRKVLLPLLILFILSSFSYSSSEKKVLTVKDMLGFKRISQLSFSPSDTRVAFVVRESDFEKSKYSRDIWMADMDKKEAFKYAFSSENESFPLWSPDGKNLAFLSNRGKAEDEEKEAKNQVWIIPANGGEAEKLTLAEEGVLTYKWMPDGEEIVCLTLESLSPSQKKKKKMDEEKKSDITIVDQKEKRKEFWGINLKEKKSQKIFVGDYGISEFDISPTGQKIVYSTNYTGEENDYTKFDLWVLDLNKIPSISQSSWLFQDITSWGLI